MTSHLRPVIGIYSVFSHVNYKLKILWIHIISSGLEGPTCFLSLRANLNTSIQRVRETLQGRYNSALESALGRHLKFTIFLVPYSRNSDDRMCSFQKAVAELCWWPPNPLEVQMRIANPPEMGTLTCLSAIAQLWEVSDSANKTFSKRTNTDKQLNTVKGLMFSAVDASSPGWRYNSTVLR